MNRLADYLYVLARYEDARAAEKKESSQKETGGTGMIAEEAVGKSEKTDTVSETVSGQSSTSVDEAVIQAVLRRIGMQGRITLEGAKKLIEKIEQEALRRGKKAVIAVCGPDGNPIAVHVMDGAFLVSFDVALKKAYTSVAVKMSTMELAGLAQPGGTFYGVDKMDGGKIVIFGGGVSVKSRGYHYRWPWHKRRYRRGRSQSGAVRIVCTSGSAGVIIKLPVRSSFQIRSRQGVFVKDEI